MVTHVLLNPVDVQPYRRCLSGIPALAGYHTYCLQVLVELHMLDVSVSQQNICQTPFGCTMQADYYTLSGAPGCHYF